MPMPVSGMSFCLQFMILFPILSVYILVQLITTQANNHARLVGVLPADLKSMPWDDVRKICLDYTVTGLEVLTDLPRDPGRKPLRFIYTSGTAAVRDPKLKPWVLGDYAVLRVSIPQRRTAKECYTDRQNQGECEVKALEAAEANSSKLETTIIKPGLITSTDPAHKSITASLRKAFCDLIGVPTIDLREMSACAINIAINGNSGKETHVNADMIDTGKKALEEGM